MSATTTAPSELPMPRLSDSMEEGTIIKWLKAEGDAVAVGEELVEIETDKAQVAFESYMAGTLIEVLAQEGDSVAVGQPIARIGQPGDAAPQRAAGKPKVSPVAKRRAAELGVDLATVVGTGPNGRIVKADIEQAAAKATSDVPAKPATTSQAEPAPASPSAASTLVPLTTLQRTVARRMVESRSTIPHFEVSAEIDMSRCRDARERLRATGARPPSFNAMVVKACALALRKHPMANASWSDAGIELHEQINVGIAVAAPGVLMVPTITDTDRKGLTEIAAESANLAERVRSGTITPAELSGGTFTVSNLGMFGADDFTAVINPPQVAILAAGAIVERPVGREGQLQLAPTMRVTLACDHRVLYGADAAALLADIRGLLEEPLGLAG